MTHFWSDLHQDRKYSTMSHELRNTHPTVTKRGNSATRSEYETEHESVSKEHHDRVLEYQRVPGADRPETSPVKRSRPSPSSSNSSSSLSNTVHRKNSRASGKLHNSATNKKLKMAELLSIKRELTVIKVQIDELLDCVDKMDRQRKDCTDCPMGRESGMVSSPHCGSVSSLDRDSPEPGEASEEETVYFQHCYTHSYSHRISVQSSDPEDDL